MFASRLQELYDEERAGLSIVADSVEDHDAFKRAFSKWMKELYGGSVNDEG